MNFQDKKDYAMQFIRLGISPYEAMLHTDFTEDEIAKAEEDPEFQADIRFNQRMEEIELLQKLNDAMEIAASKGNASAIQWKLERINSRWRPSSVLDLQSGNRPVKINLVGSDEVKGDKD